MTRILLANAVPVNNGDAALVFSLYDALKSKGFEVKIACHKYDLIKKLYPEHPIIQDILDKKWIKKTRFLAYLLLPFVILADPNYRESDIVIGVPGGYINSYYSIAKKIYVMTLCKLYGKKVGVYSQSLGPLNGLDQILVRIFLNLIDVFFARDKRSFELADKLSNNPNICLTEDAAFLIQPQPDIDLNRGHVAISVRDWKFDQRNLEQYYSLITAIAEKCVQKGYDVTFLSTCQGLDGYIDDSKVAERIQTKISDQYKKQIEVNTDYLKLSELQKRLKDYEFVIGTRLHMCILAMIGGVPAFNISYEFKGSECYNYLGIPEYSIDYNEQKNLAIQKFQVFLNEYNERIKDIRNRVEISHDDALTDLENFLSMMDNKYEE